MNFHKILLIEDEEQARSFLEDRLTEAGYEVRAAATGTAGLDLVAIDSFDIALIDINLPDITGIEVLEAIKQRAPEMDAVIMTGSPQIETAIQSLRLGAYDYLIKPLEWASLQHLLTRIIERRYLRDEVVSLRTRLGETPPIGELVGSSAGMKDLKATIILVAPTDASILIEGESGTGKELIAAAIHRLSMRSKGPFVPINCAAIPAELMESELFGHQKGSFSGASGDSRGIFRSADGGTLFLDEVAELPLPMQAKLLRVLQDKEVRPVGSTEVHHVDIRIVAATNQKLDAAVQAATFRQDLYFRLNVVRIEPPPLRTIKEDLPALVMHIVRRLNRRFVRKVSRLAPAAMLALRNYDFPGNVRELENILERAYALGANGEINLVDLPSLVSAARAVAPFADGTTRTIEEMERGLIVEALRTHENDRGRTAGALGLSERTLYRRLKKLGLN